ncbi:RibD family protein [Spirulina major CS-329]|uniref:RibD family protein n=1 Tax=Spirulina TaxID=1154 RepID=UPI00232D8578|nr:MULTISPECIES: RibD family protein [Spirulina]MDB9493821.1 RibD family protein [Spirulina subsalsa CS-330]MDB9505403.1 RibD family protein [Spirulina major CS-329]
MVHPYCTVVLAITADGKLSDAPLTPARFGSATDLAHLEAQVAQADAVLFGAGTLRAYQTTLTVRDRTLCTQRHERGQTPQPIHYVCSRQADLDPRWRFFQQPTPRGLITTTSGATPWQGRPEFNAIITTGEAINWGQVWSILGDQGMERVAVLGGGQIVGSLLRGGWVDEICLTLCPLILGEGVPWMAGQLPAVGLELLACEAIASELFLRYRVVRG